MKNSSKLTTGQAIRKRMEAEARSETTMGTVRETTGATSETLGTTSVTNVTTTNEVGTGTTIMEAEIGTVMEAEVEARLTLVLKAKDALYTVLPPKWYVPDYLVCTPELLG